MAPDKRKATSSTTGPKAKKQALGFICMCGGGREHQSKIECEREAKLKLHKDIADKVSPWSEKIAMFVGTNQYAFYVDKILLKLHSGYFRNRLADLEEDSDEKLVLPNIDPALFADFVCWMKSGRFMPVSNDVMYSELLMTAERSWVLGKELGAPGYQNFAMEDCFRWAQNGGAWPIADTVQQVYQLTRRDCKLRTYVAHSVATKSPFQTYEEGSAEYSDWMKVFKAVPELGLDVARAVGISWDGSYPWDEENQARYMEEERPLDLVWEEDILSTRTIEDITTAANNNCIRSKIELNHISRSGEK